MSTVIILGNVGKYIDRADKNDLIICNLGIAENIKKKGEKKTIWHKVVAFNKMAETILRYVNAGDKILVTGSLDYDEYENKAGTKIKSAKIILSSFEFAGSSKKEDDGQTEARNDNNDTEYHNSGYQQKPLSHPAPSQGSGSFDDDIPF